MSQQLPAGFTAHETTRPVSAQQNGVKVKIDAPAIELQYKGEAIALFVDEARRGDLPQRVREYLGTYGYLAEWTRQKLVTGVVPSWDESMRVQV